MTDEPQEHSIRKPEHRPDASIPRLVGGGLESVGKVDSAHDTLSLRSLALSLEDWVLLGLVARETCLTSGEIGEILGWSRKQVCYHRTRLARPGLLRMLGPIEIGEQAKLRFFEATVDGLNLVAAHEGFSLARAVLYLGLVGGGPEHQIGSRSALLGRFQHTRGVASVLVDLYRSARVLRQRGEDDEVVKWQNAAACARRHVRPDGYVVYRHRGELYGAFIEYDRGTMRARDYRKKLFAYADYLRSGRYARDYVGFPTMLFLTPDAVAEKRIADAARQMAAETRVRLPILLTHLWHPESEPDGVSGLLGSIWREADWAANRRGHWPRSESARSDTPPTRTS